MAQGEGRKKRRIDASTCAKQRNEGDSYKVYQLLSSFSREQLTAILMSAAAQYDTIYNEIISVANADTSHRKVFVRGLAWDTSSETLRNAFGKFGDIEEGAVIFDKCSGKSKGYGFVTFAEMEAAQFAVNQHIMMIDGRKTMCNLASLRPDSTQVLESNPSEALYPMDRREIMASSGLDDSNRKLFVRGLAWNTSDETFRREFEKYGDIEEASIARDRKTGNSKGFGFVTYRSNASAHRALQQPQKMIDNRTTHCNLACQGGSKRTIQETVMPTNCPSQAMSQTHTAYPVAYQPMGMYPAMSPQGTYQTGQHAAQPPIQLHPYPQTRYTSSVLPPYLTCLPVQQPPLPPTNRTR